MATMNHPPETTGPALDGAAVAEIQREYLEDLKCRVSPRHYMQVKARIDRVVVALNLAEKGSLQPIMVIRFRNQQLEKGISNRTANLVVDSLGAMFGWAVGCGLIATNPLRNLRRLPDGAGHQRYRRRALTDDEIRRFLDAAKEEDEAKASTWANHGGGASNHRRRGVRIPQLPVIQLVDLSTDGNWSG